MRKGFSLFEILIALSLMALLSSFALPNLQKIQNKSKLLASEINAKTFQSAVENYYLDQGIYPLGSLTASELFVELHNKDILNVTPINPFYKKAYAKSDVKGKIIYNSSSGDKYQLVLYAADGAKVRMTLVNF